MPTTQPQPAATAPIPTADAIAVDLAALWHDYNEAGSKASKAPELSDKLRYQRREKIIYQRIKATEVIASFSEVRGPQGAVCLLGLINDLLDEMDNIVVDARGDAKGETVVDDEFTDRAGRLREAGGRMINALAGWLALDHGVDRSAGVAKVYLSPYADPLVDLPAEDDEAA